jgi:DNA-binding response OmpR family regulator
LAAGCDDFDTKPVELPRLIEKIKVQLQGTMSAPPHAASGTTPGA